MTPLIDRLRPFYEILDYRNAVGILQAAAPAEFAELCDAFTTFRIDPGDLLKGGGNESNIPKTFTKLLRPNGWQETRISGDLLVRLRSKRTDAGYDLVEQKIESYIDGHKIDYVKNRVAFDLEWNSKDQTFDRDLYAFGAFYQANIIDAAVLVTRGTSMTETLKAMGIGSKYGASTTWMGKLEYRVKSNRSAGCPVLALGIMPSLVNTGTA